jgi:hypothetical protein
MKKIFFILLLPVSWGLMSFLLRQCGQNPFVYGTLPMTLAVPLLQQGGWTRHHPLEATFAAGIIIMGICGILLSILRVRKKLWAICFGVGCAAALLISVGLLIKQQAVPDNFAEICAVTAIIVNWGLVLSVPFGIIGRLVCGQKAVESIAKSM